VANGRRQVLGPRVLGFSGLTGSNALTPVVQGNAGAEGPGVGCGDRDHSCAAECS
jgi:hypothetical protein